MGNDCPTGSQRPITPQQPAAQPAPRPAATAVPSGGQLVQKGARPDATRVPSAGRVRNDSKR